MLRTINREQKRGGSTSFGVTIKERTFAAQNTRYQFNGKEYDSETETSDFGARNLDGDLGVWGTPDAVMQPSKSPYSYVDNNPIIYVDRNGEDNVIYLVALPSSKTNFTKEDVQSIANEANKIYEDMGLNTRVVVFESNQPFDPAHIDPSDSYALLGSVAEVKSTVQGDNYSAKIKIQADYFTGGGGNPEQSAVNAPGILLSSDDISNSSAQDFKTDKNSAAALLLVHGSGHNASISHNENPSTDPIMNDVPQAFVNQGQDYIANGKNIQIVGNPVNSYEKIVSKENTKGLQKILPKSLFGTNKSSDNYINNQRRSEGVRPVNPGQKR